MTFFRNFNYTYVYVIGIILYLTTYQTTAQFHQHNFNHLHHHTTFNTIPTTTSFHTFQFGAFPSTFPTTTATNPNTIIQTQPLGNIPVSPATIPQDAISRTFQPNIFNAGSNSTSLNNAMKYYCDEQYRINLQNIEYINEQHLYDGSPRSLSDTAVLKRNEQIPQRLTLIKNKQQQSMREYKSLPISLFTFDLTPIPPEPITSSTTTPTNPIGDLPSPALLLNPQVQDQIKNSTGFLEDIKDLFTPSQSTSNLISNLAHDASRNGPTASDISRSISSASSSSRPPSIPSTPSRPSIPSSSRGVGIGNGLGGLDSLLGGLLSF